MVEAVELVLRRVEDTGEVIYRTRPSRVDHPEGPVGRWDVYELISRVLDHLPAPRQQMVRYWGYYSNVARGKRRAAAHRLATGLDAEGDSLSGVGVITVPPAAADEPFRRRARVLAVRVGRVSEKRFTIRRLSISASWAPSWSPERTRPRHRRLLALPM